MKNITIIGGGLAGFTLVREIRRLNATVGIKLITADAGDYYSKPQLSVALTHKKSSSQLILISKEKFSAQFNLDILSNTRLTDLKGLINNKNIEYQIVLASGANPIILPVFKQHKIYSVNNLRDYTDFRQALENKKSVLIIGAGLLGCEFANDLINAGYPVTVLSSDAYPLQSFAPKAVGLGMQYALAQKGVMWQFNTLFDPTDRAILEKNDQIILSAIGIKPDLTLALSAGLKTNQGILVDQYLQTSHDNIYALGDCVEFDHQVLAYIAPLSIGARALAKTLLGEKTAVIYPPMPIYVKTPAYPVVILPPRKDTQEKGTWQIEQLSNQPQAVRALFYTADQQLKGFALGGAVTAETQAWLKKII